jgi:pyruvate carboxylase
MPRESVVTDRSLKAAAGSVRPKGDPANPEHTSSPMPGVVSEVAVSVGRQVAAGEKLVVLESMKMLTTISAAHAGTVTEVLVKKGDRVDSDDLLLTLVAS